MAIRISINNLKPGMKLAKPILNESGIVLIAEGTELSTASIQRLMTMGLSSVVIEGKRTQPKPKEVLLRELDMRFRKAENEELMKFLKEITIEHIEELYK
ncbi:MAG: hypothetical protein N2511_00910 [Thermodesulfovibrionales bacterium]|nr:hypothetical protein [Thermodesulfovibrionales bacterium]